MGQQNFRNQLQEIDKEDSFFWLKFPMRKFVVIKVHLNAFLRVITEEGYLIF
jgi:hypothetical protein